MTLARDLDKLDRSPLNHLRLGMLGTVLRAVELLDGHDDIVAQHPFLSDYLAEFGRLTFAKVPAATEWRSVLAVWARGHDHLPLERLRAAGLSDVSLEILLALGLAEEDVRLVALFGEGSRLTLAALIALLATGPDVEAGGVAGDVARLCELGLVTLYNSDGPRHASEFAIAPPFWEALSGNVRMPPGLDLIRVEDLPDGDAFVAPQGSFVGIDALAGMFRERRVVLSFRGPAHNGRHTLAASVMKALGKPLLSVDPQILDRPADWSLACVLACVTGAGIVTELALGPGEDRILPPIPFGDPPLMIVAGTSGGVRSRDGKPVVTVAVAAPEPGARALLWQRSGPVPQSLANELAHRFRLTSGNIVRAAADASIRSSLAGLPAIEMDQVELAVRGLHDSRLEAVARRVELLAASDFVSFDEIAMHEMNELASRCRHRERLNANGLATLGAAGVRALFSGPSGTGKTLSARWLARQLGKDMYRLDLAASVSKYIGETEKVLDRAFAAAEDLDCILLIDEGDALMARRTEVSNANDRYANLETNFLLQRIETFDGILVVTTNAAERIDKAFSRRMEVVVQFRPPDEVRRYEILHHHLADHDASDRLLQEIACRCPLTGGQLRNIAQHARLLALDDESPIGDDQLRAALLREYRKIDAHCPLKPQLATAG